MSINNGVLQASGGIQSRGGTAANLAAANPLLKAREIMVETDTGKMKIGDGVHNWNALDYVGGSGSAAGLTSETWIMVLDDGNDTEITKEVAVWETTE